MNRTGVVGIALMGAALFSAPAVAQETPASPEKMKTLIKQAMDVAEAEMFRPGPQQPDWNQGGIDLRAAAAGKPGGLAGNYFVTVDKDGEAGVSIHTAAPAANFVPPTWKALSRIGDIDAAGPDSFLEFGSLEGAYYFAARGNAKRVGDAYCSAGPAGAVLYEDPDHQGENAIAPEVVKFLFETVIAMTAKYTVCERADVKGVGYRVQYFFEDGRSVPAMDAQNDEVSIVPARPVAELLQRKAS